ncbi:MAG: polysaccharide biosynthesis protein [Solirubrobacteraceae bacterium]|jgi:FlaA1/EpsC-like NDP-sugar epimerase|nr:polysaccharide biosynthesis protein [Solirubrobacteraceae bacterium]
MRRRLSTAALPLHRHSLLQLAADGALVALAYFLAYRLRFDQSVGTPDRFQDLLEATLPWVVVLALVIFTLFRIEQRQWRYVTQRDYAGVLQAVIVLTLAVVGYVALAKPVTDPRLPGDVNVSIPTGVLALFFLLSLVLVGGVRFVVHNAYERTIRGFRARKDARRVLIVGAGDGGRLTLREIVRNPALRMNPVGFVDDDPLKLRVRIDGVKVLGATEQLPRILDEAEPDEIIIAIPSAPGTLRARVVRAGRERGIPVRTLPTVFELLQAGSGAVVRQVREVQVEDVLGREPVRMELDRVGAYLSSEVVLVTGAGGSIGAELCRQIARVAPRRLILLDHAEDNLFAIQRELEDDRHVHPSSLAAVLADCKEGERMREVFREHRPTVVFHAAAYKHVGLMELNPVEAVRNNALATRLVARLAGEEGVGRFVLVSTDKAVSPATVMGASKALAEYAVEEMTTRFPQTRYACVRFGNVLGSSGSVVPIFRRQIARGGPVTVTDERMTRYFMTIPEAVQLIIRSGSLGSGGEIFVLEMGEPVPILQLARDMIELSGLSPDEDIAIEITGRRPGEKLHEELFNPYERAQPTPAEKILLAARDQRDPAEVAEWFDEISLLVLEGDAAGLAAKVGALASGASESVPARAHGPGEPGDGGSGGPGV